MTEVDIFAHVRATLVELFELDPATITPASTIFEDLDLDSIDAIDLVAKLQQFTDSRIEESQMRDVRTVADLVGIVSAQLEARSSGASAAS